jgi:hypothetical protein
MTQTPTQSQPDRISHDVVSDLDSIVVALRLYTHSAHTTLTLVTVVPRLDPCEQLAARQELHEKVEILRIVERACVSGHTQVNNFTAFQH